MLEKRSYQPELLDADNIPFADIKQTLKELNVINTWLGGHALTVGAFKELAKDKKEISVCEIGCGGGDNLLAIHAFCNKNNIKVNLIGIDIKAECTDYAKSRNAILKNATWITSDYQSAIFDKKPDIIFSSLFCHHFTDPQLLEQLSWMKQNSAIGFFINDLHRNIIAFYAIKFLTALFSRSYLVKNDASLSVARGFSKRELQQLCAKAGVNSATVKWKWAFRFVVLFRHDN
jgi:2-polyprenyl-3-methyl-5-hydroxy-6-metoxy-1,4-benzoquinol methylase